MVMVSFSEASREESKIYQLSDSIYKVAEFSGAMPTRSFYPAGTPGALTINESEHELQVDCGDAHVTIHEDDSWF